MEVANNSKESAHKLRHVNVNIKFQEGKAVVSFGLRRELKSALVDALAASTSVRATFALAEIAEKGDAGAIAAVSARLEDADSAVRSAAVDALPKIAEKGGAGALAACTRMCMPTRYNTRAPDGPPFARASAVDCQERGEL